jgi:nucleoside-diphosphate-sugar epimerase
MQAVVTGSTGFVGGHLVDRLIEEGCDVLCLVRKSSSTERLEKLPVRRQVIRGYGDPDLARILSGVDCIFHVAGLTRARTAEPYLMVNRDATLQLLHEALKAETTPRRFVYVSSLAAVGPNLSQEVQNEETAPHPHDHYGRSKRAGEEVVLAAKKDLPVTIVRPPVVYGTRDRNFVPMFRAASKSGIAPVIGSPDKQISMVYATDLADGIWRAGTHRDAVGQTYFITGGNHTFSEITDALAGAVERPLRTIRVPAWAARLLGELGELKWTLTGKPQIVCRRKINDLLQPAWTCSYDKAQREIGYTPKVSLAEGMKKTAEWYRETGSL